MSGMDGRDLESENVKARLWYFSWRIVMIVVMGHSFLC